MTRLIPLRAVSLAVVFACPISAQPTADTAPVADVIAPFNEAFTAGDTEDVLAVMPPELLADIATQFGTRRTELRARMITSAQAAIGPGEEVDVGSEGAAAEINRTSEVRAHVLIYTISTMAVEGSKDWYLTHVDDPGQVALPREVFPNMTELAFAGGPKEDIG